MNRTFRALCLATLALTASRTAVAAPRPHPLFSDGVVLQRGRDVPVWGTAAEGEKVTVRFQDQDVATTAQNGKWSVRLQPLKTGGPFALTIAGDATVTINNVLVGDVWVCSGQSNMGFPLSRSVGAEEAVSRSADPGLRLFTVPRKTSDDRVTDDFSAEGFPLRPGEAGWKEARPGTVASFSAVAYYFGRDLRAALDVPIGLVHSSVGGTPAEAWTPRSALEADAGLRLLFEKDAEALKVYPEALEKFQVAEAAYKTAAAQAKADGKPAPRAPRAPAGPKATSRPSVLYNGMIAPLQPFAITGVIWYQGEANAGRAFEYRTLFPTMIQSWRSAWKQGDFPFLFVQLAPYQKIRDEPSESAWAELREAQLKTSQSLPNTGMAVVTDVGDETDVHPRRKAEVGARLARAARAVAYGETLVASGPEYAGMDVADDHAVVRFQHVGGGLVARPEPLSGFAVAGADHTFFNAEAAIQGETVLVHSPKVERPVAVRYGWADFPLGNLWNRDGLPASPFRTDDFPMSTRPQPRGQARTR